MRTSGILHVGNHTAKLICFPMTAEDFFPPYHLFERDVLQLSFPHEWSNVSDWADHWKRISQEIASDLILEADGSRDKAMRVLQQRQSYRQSFIDKGTRVIEETTPVIRELIFDYYSAARRYLEQSRKIEEVKSNRRDEAARIRDHSLNRVAFIVKQINKKERFKQLVDQAYHDEIDRLERSGGFAHFDLLVRSLYMQICHGTEWSGDGGVARVLDNLKEQYFVPDHVDADLRRHLKPLHERLRQAQWSLYEIHERLPTEEAYLEALLRGMPVASMSGEVANDVEYSDAVKEYLRTVVKVSRSGHEYSLAERWFKRIGRDHGVTPQAVENAFHRCGLIRDSEKRSDYKTYRERIEAEAVRLESSTGKDDSSAHR